MSHHMIILHLKHSSPAYARSCHLLLVLPELERRYKTFNYHMTSRLGVQTPYNRIDKPLVVYRFTENVRTSITTLHT